MAYVKKSTWKKLWKGASGLQLRVRDLVRKLRPERVGWQLRHLLATVDQRWPPNRQSPSTPLAKTHTIQQEELSALVVECEVLAATDKGETCSYWPADPLMSTHLPLQVTQSVRQEEEKERNGSVRPSELSLGGLVPPSPTHTPRNKSPVTVQEWVDSLPLTPTEVVRGEEEAESEPRVIVTQDSDDNLTLGAEAGLMCGALPPAVQVTSCKEPSESGSHCSSVESLLEARKPDPEEVLLSLGFGGSVSSASECRIPQRFLKPSQLRGVAIDDFLRQQQEMVQTFETGFCGYRGLSGPSHTIPSVIVAKIMEKLREHERESSSAASPPHASTNTDPNKFSRVAHNVLTKIRCVPGSSVLTPDNRKWLDSQGHKSPEANRKRIIIGQQSFTFSQDGNLIESQSPPSSLTDSDSRWTSSTGTPGVMKPELATERPGFPSIQEDIAECLPSPSPQPKTNPFPFPARHAFANVVTSLLADKHQESKSSSSMDVLDEDKHWTRFVGDSGLPSSSRSVGDSGLPSSGRSSRGLEDCDSPVNPLLDPNSLQEYNSPITDNLLQETKPCLDSELENIILLSNLTFSNTNFDQETKCSAKISNHLEDIYEIFKPTLDDSGNLSSLPLSDDSKKDIAIIPKKDVNSLQLYNDKIVLLDNLNKGPQLSDQLSPPCVQTSLQSSEKSVLISRLPSLASELENALVGKFKTSSESDAKSEMLSERHEIETISDPSSLGSAPVRVIQSLDKVIESLEKIMEPLEVMTENETWPSSTSLTHSETEQLLHSYEDLKRLTGQLRERGVVFELGTLEKFISLTIHERCELQCYVVRKALSEYQSELTLDTSQYQLKCCLSTEVQRLSDLLDTTSDPHKLSTLVNQISELLKHQADLRSQLEEWNILEPSHIPLECHPLCGEVLQRLKALELIVHRNTQTLSELRNKD